MVGRALIFFFGEQLRKAHVAGPILASDSQIENNGNGIHLYFRFSTLFYDASELQLRMFKLFNFAIQHSTVEAQ